MPLSRGIGATLLAALSHPVRYPLLLIYIDWPSGAVRFHTNRPAITWSGETWTGAGHLADIRLPDGGSGFERQTGEISLVGSLSDVFASAGEAAKNRAVKVYYGQTTTPGGGTLIGDPFLRWNGFVDAPDVVMTGGQYRLRIQTASGPGAKSVGSISHNYEDQIAAHPGDIAGRHTALAAANAEKLKWPE
jgi:hypothetical protein